MYIFSKIQLIEVQPCADPESYVRGCPTLIFLVDEGREDQNTTIGGPSSADNGPTLNAGLVACDFSGDLDQYCLETIFFVMFKGGGGGVRTPCPPSGSAHDKQGSVLKVLCQNLREQR